MIVLLIVVVVIVGWWWSVYKIGGVWNRHEEELHGKGRR